MTVRIIWYCKPFHQANRTNDFSTNKFRKEACNIRLSRSLNVYIIQYQDYSKVYTKRHLSCKIDGN